MEIILFTYGDARKASTWSNIPYLMAETLESLGHTVRRIDISADRWVSRLTNAVYNRILHWEGYSFYRTSIFRRITERKIKKAVTTYSGADFAIFLNFDYCNRYNRVPSLLLSDWTYRTFIEDRLGLKLEPRDRRFVKQQEQALHDATVVLPLFSETAEKMKADYPEANIACIPYNVINNLSGITTLDASQLRNKYRSDYILFVGRPAYKTGLLKLIEAIKTIDAPTLRVEVIGMTADDIPQAPPSVHFNGFLHKDVPAQRDRYYSLMTGARCIVNPTSKWAAYSSIVEGMYFYNPVIVTPFSQFVKEFGGKIPFGFYIDEHTPGSLARSIETLLGLPEHEYIAMSLAAHDSVKHYTWQRYATDMTRIMAALTTTEH